MLGGARDAVERQGAKPDRHSAEPNHSGGEMGEACEVDCASLVADEAQEVLEAIAAAQAAIDRFPLAVVLGQVAPERR